MDTGLDNQQSPRREDHGRGASRFSAVTAGESPIPGIPASLLGSKDERLILKPARMVAEAA